MNNFTEEMNRIYLNDANGRLVAEVTFPEVDDNTVNINHTFVDDSLRGQGIASKLIEAAANKLQKENKKVVLTCSYAVHWFEKNKDYANLLK